MMQAIADEHGGSAFEWATQPEDRSRLWKARHNAYYAAMALRPGKQAFSTDACVPISRLADCVLETRADVDRDGLDRADRRSRRRRQLPPARAVRSRRCRPSARRPRTLAQRVSLRAIAMGGTCTGEHGIGMHKLDALVAEHGEAVDLMQHDQARARSAQHHESRQDRSALTDMTHVHALHRQQELLVVVAARLARDEALRRAVPRRCSQPFDGDRTNPANRAFSPTALRARACTTATTVVWDSLAIAEYLAERHPGMWPDDPVARAWARSIAARDALGLRDAAQRHDDVHPRARRRAAVVGRRSPPTSRASRRSGTKARRRFGAGRRLTSAARSRSPMRSTRRSRSASRPTALRRRARPASTCARCSRIRCCANGKRRRSRRRRSSRRTSRASSIATSSTARGRALMTDAAIARRAGRRASARRPRRGAPLRIRGGGTKDFYGEALAGDVLDTRAYAGIVDYEPTELVITARAGTPLADDRERDARARPDARVRAAALRRRARRSAAPSPRACPGRGGPMPARCATSCSACAMLDGRGEDLTFGGRVMKNVAGFDVARLMTRRARHARRASPRCRSSACRCRRRRRRASFECSADEAIRRVNEWGGQPLPLSATCYHDGPLAVRLVRRATRGRMPR